MNKNNFLLVLGAWMRKWPPPKLEALKQQSHLTEEQIGYLSENLIDHPAPSVEEKANIHRRYIATD